MRIGEFERIERTEIRPKPIYVPDWPKPNTKPNEKPIQVPNWPIRIPEPARKE